MTFQEDCVVDVTIYEQVASEILGDNQTECETWSSPDYKSTDVVEN
jgi:hypothetical protein